MINSNDSVPWNHLLLSWYALEKRSFPWRDEFYSNLHTHIYHTWVCEIMSQQTTLAVVLPRFNQFIKTLPNLNDLANCSDELLRYLWSGLGYYARARNLRSGALFILNQFGGVFPTTQQEWLSVPGCGPYTSSIIASVCFNEPVAAIDGNVIRVASRLLGLKSEAWEKSGQEKISAYMNACISKKSPGDFNQAMMDLGAVVCKKQNPNCEQCPLTSVCTAHKSDTTDLCPSPKPRQEKRLEKVYAIILVRKKRQELLLVERTAGFLSKTFGFPLFAERDGFSFEKISSLAQKMNAKATLLEKTFQHTITCHKITGNAVLLECAAEDAPLRKNIEDHFLSSSKKVWLPLSSLKENLSSSLDHKVCAIIKNTH